MTRHAFGICFCQPSPRLAQQVTRQMTAQLDAILNALDALSLEPPVDEIYGDLRAGLERTTV